MGHWRLGAAISGLCLGLLGCANTVPLPKISQATLLFSLKVQGKLDTMDGNLRYYVVFDTTPDPNNGPRCQGPVPSLAPQTGWDLPFSANPGTVPNAIPVLQPVEWTDYYELTGSSGVPLVTHGENLGPILSGSNGALPQINPSVGQLVKGIDWDMPDASTLRLIIQAGSLNFPTPPAMPGTLPDPVKFDVVTTNSQGQVIDVWNNDFYHWYTFPGNIGSIYPQTNPLNAAPTNPGVLPGGVSAPDATIQSYEADVKG